MIKAIFLDRDGTINKEKNFLYKINDFEYTDRAIEALQNLSKLRFLLVIITNQSGIARGLYTENDLNNLHEWMLKDLWKKHVPIEAIYYCPHHPQAAIERYKMTCSCRKPGTALFWKAIDDYKIDVDYSYVIGDNLRDIDICRECLAQGILITDDKSVILKAESMHYYKKIWISHSLYDAAKQIVFFESKILNHKDKGEC